MKLRKHKISHYLTKILYLCVTGTFIRGGHPHGAANAWDQTYINSQNQFTPQKTMKVIIYSYSNDFNVSGYLQLLKILSTFANTSHTERRGYV